MTLEPLPALSRKTFQEVFPSNVVLLTDSLFDVVGPTSEVDGETVSPLGNRVYDCIGDVGVSIMFIKGGGEGVERSLIDVVGLMPSTLLDMSGILSGVVASGADCICLVVPFNKSCANPTIFAGVLGYPFAAAVGKLVHKFGGHCPVNIGCGGKSVVSLPPCLG